MTVPLLNPTCEGKTTTEGFLQHASWKSEEPKPAKTFEIAAINPEVLEFQSTNLDETSKLANWEN